MSEAAVPLALPEPVGDQSEGWGGERHLRLLWFKILLPSEKFGVTRPAGFQITYPTVAYSQERRGTSPSLPSPPQASGSALGSQHR